MMTQKVLLGKYIFKLLFLQYGLEPYLELNQKSMVELFCKNSDQLLVFNFFRKKSPTANVQLCSKKASVACKKKRSNFLYYTITHNFI